MFEVSLLLVVIVVTALVFDFTNGAHDCANAIASVVSTKVLTPRAAVAMAAAQAPVAVRLRVSMPRR